MAKLYFYYSAMNAGKSTNLLQSAYNYEEREMRSLIFTPKLDDRFGEGKITSRIGLERDVEKFEGEDDLYKDAENDEHSDHELNDAELRDRKSEEMQTLINAMLINSSVYRRAD